MTGGSYSHDVGAGVGIKNKINITNYKYMCTCATAGLDSYSSSSIVIMGMDIGKELIECGSEEDSVICYENEILDKTIFNWDISELKGMANPLIFAQAHFNGYAGLDIYAVYLLK